MAKDFQALSDEHVDKLQNAPPWIVGSSDVSLQPIINTLSRVMRSGQPPDQLLVDGASSLLTFNLTQLANITKSAGRLSPKRLGRVSDYINDNLERNLSLTDLAHCVGLSTPHFAAVFRASTGISPHKFVLQRRIDRAKELLHRDDLSLIEVALQSGFNSQSHFTSAFRRVTGMVPTRFREEIA
jgi:AraC family transcriptional regulator